MQTGRSLKWQEFEVFKRPLFARNWWVIAIIGFSYLLYAHGIQKKKEALFQLEKRLHTLQHERGVAIELQNELKLQVQSQKDPAWIEMTLMKGLGLVPDGQRKVYFEKTENK
ncbi:MAG: hypothetical protein HYX48_04355 [Chlamydiales bacterium]|nr:hypothetical protein [Chlamydiales bacterium]